jgi:hypothetical protein
MGQPFLIAMGRFCCTSLQGTGKICGIEFSPAILFIEKKEK